MGRVKELDRAEELVQKAILKARELAEDRAGLGEGEEGGGGTGYRVPDVRGDGTEGLVQQVRSGCDGTVETPAGSDHGVDGAPLFVILGAALLDILLKESIEVVLGLGLEDHSGGVEAVDDAVAGSAQLSLGRFRTAGEGPVGSGGSDSDTR